MDLQKRLCDFAAAEAAYWDFSGVIQVIRRGELLLELSRGAASLEFGVPNTPATRFEAASVTKQFTAFAVMLLAGRGLLDPDAPANRYLPAPLQLPTPVTVHQLLSHTSGLHNNYNFEDDFYVGADRAPYYQETFFRDWICREPIRPPGGDFAYNNSNYTLLAWIVEAVSDRPFGDFLAEQIFAPLGMDSTAIDDGQNILPGKASNYTRNYGVLSRVPYTNPLFGLGAGGLVTTCGDLQKWYECLKHRALLPEWAYRRYLAENKNHYCCGLERHSDGGAVWYVHGGDALGVSAYTRYDFQEDSCILLLANTDTLDQYRLGRDLAEILRGGRPAGVRRAEEYPVSPECLEQYTGTYLPGRIQIQQRDGTLYLVRVNQQLHIALYGVAPGCFQRRFEEQAYIHRLLPEGARTPSVWGYERISTRLF